MTQFRLLEVLTKFPIYCKICSQIFFDLSKKKPLWIWHKSSVHAVVFIEISCKIQAFGYAYLVHNTELFHDQGSYYNTTALYCNSFLFSITLFKYASALAYLLSRRFIICRDGQFLQSQNLWQVGSLPFLSQCGATTDFLD